MDVLNWPLPPCRRVLLADDDPVLQRTFKRLFESQGHELVQATEGAAVLALAVSSQPDLIVLDMAFPDADGRDVLAKLKADPRTANIPVVVWSGRREHTSDSRISLELGAEDYVEKNDPQLLLRKLERVLLRLVGDPRVTARREPSASLGRHT